MGPPLVVSPVGLKSGVLGAEGVVRFGGMVVAEQYASQRHRSHVEGPPTSFGDLEKRSPIGRLVVYGSSGNRASWHGSYAEGPPTCFGGLGRSP